MEFLIFLGVLSVVLMIIALRKPKAPIADPKTNVNYQPEPTVRPSGNPPPPRPTRRTAKRTNTMVPTPKTTTVDSLDIAVQPNPFYTPITLGSYQSSDHRDNDDRSSDYSSTSNDSDSSSSSDGGSGGGD